MRKALPIYYSDLVRHFYKSGYRIQKGIPISSIEIRKFKLLLEYFVYCLLSLAAS